MAPPTKRRAWPDRIRIWIADPAAADYDCLSSTSDSRWLDIRFLASAGDLLRCWSKDIPDVCLVNARFSDTGGFDLVEMLGPFPEGITVGIVGDRYAVEDEVRALSLGVHHYLCKPLDAAVLSEICTRRKRHRTLPGGDSSLSSPPYSIPYPMENLQ
jgi:DNA-binding NtrC family response regulator